jgi:chitinase
LAVNGTTDLTYTIGGVGNFDVAKAKNGNPSWYAGEKEPLEGHRIYATGMKGWASYKPYISVDYMMATTNGDDYADSEVSFNGLLSTRVKSPLGPVVGSFPLVSLSGSPRDTSIGDPKISVPSGNIMYSSGSGKAQIAMSCYVSLGLDVDFGAMVGDDSVNFEGPDVSTTCRTFVS